MILRAALLAGCAFAASAGCGRAPGFAEGEPTPRSLGDRKYLVTLPKAYDPTRAYPVVLSFHGWQEDADWLAYYDGLVETAQAGTIIAVHPDGAADGVPDEASATSNLTALVQGAVQGAGEAAGEAAATASTQFKGWNAVGSSVASGASEHTCDVEKAASMKAKDRTPCYKSCSSCHACSWTTCADDVGFVEKLLDTLEDELCVDTAQVRAQGESNGGMMVFELLQSRLASRFSSLVSIVASPGADSLQLPAAPVAYLGLWGREDHTMPPGTPDEESVMSKDGFRYSSMHNSTQTIAEHYGCRPDPVPVTMTHEPHRVSCFEYEGCVEGSVTMCTFKGKHIWPRWLSTFLNGYYDFQMPVKKLRKPVQLFRKKSTLRRLGL
jgi:poly(3-hydroxybutyrate) depolymerase